MGKTKSEKIRSSKHKDKKHKLNLKPSKTKSSSASKPPKKKKHNPAPAAADDPILFPSSGSDSDSPSPSDPDRIQRLLEPYSKDQLLSLLLDAALSSPSLLSQIRSLADASPSHRKVFVHGLGWDATSADLHAVFSPFGPLEDCNVVADKQTGRAKGFGFVTFTTRADAFKALREPQKKIKNRFVSCQLASIGPGQPSAPADGRRIYVSNVYQDAPPEKLKSFFAKFGEIEAGPVGFDKVTGKSRGYAIFVYKMVEGAKKVLEEPYKMFEGHQLHCQVAADSKGKAAAAQQQAVVPQQQQPALGAMPQPVLAAVAAAQNLALYNQNPAYAALFAQNPMMAATGFNPAAAAGLLNPAVGQGYGAQNLAGMGGGAPSVLGAYGAQNFAGFQRLQGFQGSNVGQASSVRPGTSLGGFTSYM